jgi:hypothetical protein
MNNHSDVYISDAVPYVAQYKYTRNSPKNISRKSRRVIKTKKGTLKFNKLNELDMKRTFSSIHNIESDVEYTDVKLTKRKLADRETDLKRKQLLNVPSSKAFRPGDIRRIVLHTNVSIFDKENCSIWTGYITNLKNKSKGTYINFYFRNKKKVALHRLLYANFKGDIGAHEYVKYSCSNKGRCCNINHMVKMEYNSAELDNPLNEIEQVHPHHDAKILGCKKNTNRIRARKRADNKKSNTNTINNKKFKIKIY